jgi:hypothetical protein
MNSTAFSLLSADNPNSGENQITFGTIDFLPHSPTLAPIFANLGQETNLTIGSLNFLVGPLGSTRLSDSMEPDPSVQESAKTTTLEASVGSSSEANSSVNIKSTKSTTKELDEIMENLDLEESSGRQESNSDENSIKSNVY